MLILDDFAVRELSMPHADDLYELITGRAGRSIIFTSNRTPNDWYPLFPNPVVAESILDRIVLLRDGKTRGRPVDDEVSTGDLSDCHELYFDPDGYRSC